LRTVTRELPASAEPRSTQAPKKPKKEFELPGQKFDTPAEARGAQLRETLC
jgi:hypothetical protein